MFDVRLTNVCFAYKQQVLFEHLNLSLTAGSFTCLLGPSGVGKSSLLQLLANLPPSSDAVIQKSIHTSDGLPLTGRIAWMAQYDNLLPWLSLIDNVLLGYRLRHCVTVELKQYARQLLSRVGFNDVDLVKKITALSGGMRQRVALVRTLLEDKPLVLMDEPFSALDSITRFSLQSLSCELLRSKTVLLITHDPLEALRLADVIYILKGSPAQLIPCSVPLTPTPRYLNDQLLTEQARLWQQLADEKVSP